MVALVVEVGILQHMEQEFLAKEMMALELVVRITGLEAEEEEKALLDQ
jgi:hypothetical protein